MAVSICANYPAMEEMANQSDRVGIRATISDMQQADASAPAMSTKQVKKMELVIQTA